jgi:hypothetical protein
VVAGMTAHTAPEFGAVEAFLKSALPKLPEKLVGGELLQVPVEVLTK